MKVIIVSGTPGTGKTTISKKVSKLLNFEYVDVNKIIKKENLCESYDKKRDCMIVDENKLQKNLSEYIKKSRRNLIIDSHMSYFIPSKLVNLCIITSCTIEKLRPRLEKRKYSKSKIKENLESEIFNVCLEEAKQAKHTILEISTSEKLDYSELIKSIKKQLYR